MFNKDIGIDLGTANTLVYVRNKGVVINEPSVVAIDTITREVLAVGNDAKEMIGRTPGNIIAIRPMKDGAIADYAVTEAMLRYFISKAYPKNPLSPKPRIVICVPSGITPVEKRAVIEAATGAGARERHIYIIEEPMAAALGANLKIDEPAGNMVVDIGGGTSEVAVISLGGIVSSRSVRIAGDQFDSNIINYVRNEYKIDIGEITAETIKTAVGCAYIDINTDIKEITVKGRDLVTGLPKPLTINSRQVQSALADSVDIIIDAIKRTLEDTPPELAADIMEIGIYLTGGGALLAGLDKLISKKTGMPVHIAENPLECVVNGAGKIIDDVDIVNKLTSSDKKTLA